MGDLFGGSTKQTSTSTTDSGPSKFQQPYLQGAFDAAQKDFTSKQGTPYYQGATYAGMTDSAKATLDKLKAYAGSTGLNSANTLSSIGTDLAGYAGKAGSTIDSYLAAASEDPTASITASARAYAADPSIQGVIDASTRDVARTLNEDTLPTLNRNASGTGNINSSRAGIAEGIARRGAEDRVGDISATIRSDAYNRGLSLASQERSNKLNAMGSAASAYQGIAGTGISALGAGTAAGYGAFGAIAGADQSLQADQQGQLDADFDKWRGEDTRAADLLSRYYGIIGNNAWGSSGTSTGTQETKQSQGFLGGLAGLASTGLGIAGGLGWKPFK
ncbi:hypothetical protein [Sphingomonas sp. BK580]|uniref:hypothetical protein n=1 Tax=Sphingomonas sp. BK580 TaxID=2586972 RepID=UPI00160DFEC1|nr:hypothetical protein [Sphingomonas sp. BK580]MBB3693013.1 hypothetical protein [Sphingomonas sp. BK580]